MTCVEPRGAFYFFPNVQQLIGGELATSVQLAEHLIDRAHVVTVPGSAFGRDGYLRVSYATSLELLEEAMERLHAACAEILG